MRRAAGLVAVALLLAGWTVPASAQELSLTVGLFLGDDLLEPVRPELPSVSLEDATIFGVRLNVPITFIELEATVLTGKSGVFVDSPLETDVRVVYAEAGALVKLLPGPIAPYLAAGLGLHRLSFNVVDGASTSELGYMIGTGLKVGLGPVGARVDIRDHITPLDAGEIDPAVGEVLGLDVNTTLHNFELSAALVIRF
jgi:hypothetical protein